MQSCELHVRIGGRWVAVAGARLSKNTSLFIDFHENSFHLCVARSNIHLETFWNERFFFLHSVDSLKWCSKLRRVNTSEWKEKTRDKQTQEPEPKCAINFWQFSSSECLGPFFCSATLAISCRRLVVLRIFCLPTATHIVCAEMFLSPIIVGLSLHASSCGIGALLFRFARQLVRHLKEKAWKNNVASLA